MMIIDNSDLSQFEWNTDKGSLVLEYAISDCKYYLNHLEFDGISADDRMIITFLDEVIQILSRKGMEIVPLASEVQHYFNENPQWCFLLSEGYQM